MTSSVEYCIHSSLNGGRASKRTNCSNFGGNGVEDNKYPQDSGFDQRTIQLASA